MQHGVKYKVSSVCVYACLRVGGRACVCVRMCVHMSVHL